MKINYKIHYFDAEKIYATVCNIRRPSNENWQRKDYCTTNIKKVTCKNCLKTIGQKQK